MAESVFHEGMEATGAHEEEAWWVGRGSRFQKMDR